MRQGLTSAALDSVRVYECGDLIHTVVVSRRHQIKTSMSWAGLGVRVMAAQQRLERHERENESAANKESQENTDQQAQSASATESAAAVPDVDSSHASVPLQACPKSSRPIFGITHGKIASELLHAHEDADFKQPALILGWNY